jgi:PTS system mannose-specific IIB component/fructoselysine and glucoselysine-specific PTS system IIB component
VSIALYRVDDRLIHGQVVVGWGQPLACAFIVLVDDEVRDSDWEQDLYRMGVPDHIEVVFASVREAAERLAAWDADPRVGILLIGDIETAASLLALTPQVRRLNIGGVHHRPGRIERLRYVYLTPTEGERLREIAARGVTVTAQDVPTARAVPLAEFA